MVSCGTTTALSIFRKLRISSSRKFYRALRNCAAAMQTTLAVNANAGRFTRMTRLSPQRKSLRVSCADSGGQVRLVGSDALIGLAREALTGDLSQRRATPCCAAANKMTTSRSAPSSTCEWYCILALVSVRFSPYLCVVVAPRQACPGGCVSPWFLFARWRYLHSRPCYGLRKWSPRHELLRTLSAGCERREGMLRVYDGLMRVLPIP